MKNDRLVWLPPVGDHRLLRYQEKLVSLGGFNFQFFPPILVTPGEWPDRVNLPEIRLGAWVEREEGPALAGPLPGSFFWMGWKGFVPPGAPEPPSLTWTKGRLAIFSWRTPEPDVLIWTFSSWKPWR